MAVVNQYVNSDIVNGNLAVSAYFSGAGMWGLNALVAVAAADDDTSKYRIAKVPATWTPFSIVATNTEITSGTDYDLGLYYTLEGALEGAVTTGGKDVLADGIDMSSARAEGSGISMLSAVAVADAQKPIWELAGDTIDNHQSSYDIVLTANTVGSAAGTIALKALFLPTV